METLAQFDPIILAIYWQYIGNICIFHARDTFEVVKVGRERQKSPSVSEASRVNGIVLGLDFSISLLTLRVG